MASATSIALMCGTCGSHAHSDSRQQRPFIGLAPKLTIERLQRSARQCPNGGCKLLLQAIREAFPEIDTKEVLEAKSGRTVALVLSPTEAFHLYVTEGKYEACAREVVEFDI